MADIERLLGNGMDPSALKRIRSAGGEGNSYGHKFSDSIRPCEVRTAQSLKMSQSSAPLC